MMGVYIKGIEMPTRCWDCLLNTYGYCMASDEHSDIIPSDAPIPEWCPLVPVPPHGDLIDRDALKKKRHWTDDYYETEYVEIEDVDYAPTIIPADPAEEGE